MTRSRSTSPAGMPSATLAAKLPSAMKRFCETYPMRFCHARRLAAVSGVPSMAISPPLGSYSPSSRLKSVVFPAPEAPRIPMRSPLRIVSERP